MGELNKARWGCLRDLIDNRIRESKENLTRAIVKEIRVDVQDTSLDVEARARSRTRLEQCIWQQLERGELDASQHEMLLRVLREEPGDSGTRSVDGN